ncbi:hypothetical protein R6Q59_017974 [Mikania micrantha]
MGRHLKSWMHVAFPVCAPKEVYSICKQEHIPALLLEIVLRVFVHSEGCARKVYEIKGFHGVEDIETSFKAYKVVARGRKADLVKVLVSVAGWKMDEIEKWMTDDISAA